MCSGGFSIYTLLRTGYELTQRKTIPDQRQYTIIKLARQTFLSGIAQSAGLNLGRDRRLIPAVDHNITIDTDH